MEKHLQEYARWQAQQLPEELAAELAAIRGDESKIYDRFCRTMHFGTSGLRGRMGRYEPHQRDPVRQGDASDQPLPHSTL